jgi:hypothetical protein
MTVTKVCPQQGLEHSIPAIPGSGGHAGPLLAGRVAPPLWPHVLLAAAGIAWGTGTVQHIDHPTNWSGSLCFAYSVALIWPVVKPQAVLPQAQFAIFAQAITSFDLSIAAVCSIPSFTVWLISRSASFEPHGELGLYLLLFKILSGCFLWPKERMA